jgi:acyl-coenzyme A synthetase/AMP-(fatty) acid ligase
VSIGRSQGWHEFGDVIAMGSEDFQPEVLEAEEPALLYYTSGSTGLPKGVLHATRAVFAWRESARSWLDLRPGDTIWCTADTGWSKAGTSILFGPWSMGACSFFHDGPFDARERLRLLQKYEITVYCAPGTELFRLVNEDIGSFDLRRLRRTVTAGEALNVAVADRWKAATGIDVAEAYGQTETLMSLGCPASEQPRPGSMGIPLGGCAVDVIDERGTPLPDGEEGDLAILAPNPQFMLGYLGEPERTRQCYLSAPDGRQWFVTGDRAERHADGWFHYRGRRDDIINSAGYRIGPGEVENALLSHPDVLEAAVVGVPDTERGEIVKAFIVLRSGSEASEALKKDIQEHVKQTTAPYKYPRAVEFLPELPKTLTGKIQRVALRAMEKDRAASRAAANTQGSFSP